MRDILHVAPPIKIASGNLSDTIDFSCRLPSTFEGALVGRLLYWVICLLCVFNKANSTVHATKAGAAQRYSTGA